MAEVYLTYKVSGREFILALYDFLEQNGTGVKVCPETRKCLDVLLDNGIEGLFEKSLDRPENYAKVLAQLAQDREFIERIKPYLAPFLKPRKSLNKENART